MCVSLSLSPSLSPPFTFLFALSISVTTMTSLDRNSETMKGVIHWVFMLIVEEEGEREWGITGWTLTRGQRVSSAMERCDETLRVRKRRWSEGRNGRSDKFPLAINHFCCWFSKRRTLIITMYNLYCFDVLTAKNVEDYCWSWEQSTNLLFLPALNIVFSANSLTFFLFVLRRSTKKRSSDNKKKTETFEELLFSNCNDERKEGVTWLEEMRRDKQVHGMKEVKNIEEAGLRIENAWEGRKEGRGER